MDTVNIIFRIELDNMGINRRFEAYNNKSEAIFDDTTARFLRRMRELIRLIKFTV
jgi:hypothetical protein